MIAALLLAASAAGAAPCCDAASPYRPGEAMAAVPATCETLGRWIAEAPDARADRISMTVTGRLAAVDRDAALAYLVLCPEGGAQVLCVTYETLGLRPGQTVTVAGGILPAGEGRMMLDPCLAITDPAAAAEPVLADPAPAG